MTTGGIPIPIPCIAENLLQVGPSGNRTGHRSERPWMMLDFHWISQPFFPHFTYILQKNW